VSSGSVVRKPVHYDTITLRWNLDRMLRSWNSVIGYGFWYPILKFVNGVRLVEHRFTSLNCICMMQCVTARTLSPVILNSMHFFAMHYIRQTMLYWVWVILVLDLNESIRFFCNGMCQEWFSHFHPQWPCRFDCIIALPVTPDMGNRPLSLNVVWFPFSS